MFISRDKVCLTPPPATVATPAPIDQLPDVDHPALLAKLPFEIKLTSFNSVSQTLMSSIPELNGYTVISIETVIARSKAVYWYRVSIYTTY
jgi:hypothetical protein